MAAGVIGVLIGGWVILVAVALHTVSTVRTLRAAASSMEPVTQIQLR